MKITYQKIFLPTSIINPLIKGLNTHNIENINFSIEKEVFSELQLNIIVKSHECFNIDGEKEINLVMFISIYNKENIEVFTQKYNMFDVYSIFQIIHFNINNCEYIISLEEEYNTINSYERKKNLLSIRKDSIIDIEYMFKIIDFRNKYEVVDLIYLILLNIDIIDKHKDLVNNILNKLNYYGYDIEETITNSDKCIYTICDALNSVYENFLKYNKYTINTKSTIIYNNYINALVDENLIKRC